MKINVTHEYVLNKCNVQLQFIVQMVANAFCVMKKQVLNKQACIVFEMTKMMQFQTKHTKSM